MDADVLSSDDVMCSCTIQIQGREPKQWYDLTTMGNRKVGFKSDASCAMGTVEFSERQAASAGGSSGGNSSAFV